MEKKLDEKTIKRILEENKEVFKVLENYDKTGELSKTKEKKEKDN